MLVEKALTDFESAMDDDFNTAAALAAIHDMSAKSTLSLADEVLQTEDQKALFDAIAKFDSRSGHLRHEDEELLDADIEALIDERQRRGDSETLPRSDEIRDLLPEKGIILEDTKDGVRWKRK